jgi:tetratricopeptide (TPR) repeat protein
MLFFRSLSVFSQINYQQTFSEGVDLYTSGNYEQAATKWESLYHEGYRSADLAYNIGNACFKMNNLPGALLYYERALLASPGNEDVRYNLQIARAMVTDKFKEIPELFFIEWYNIVSLSLSTNSWAISSFVTFVLFLITLSLFFFSGAYRVKVTAFWLSVILIIISLSSLAFSVRNKNLVYNSGKAIITSPVVNGKSSPDESGKDLFVLHEGTKVTAGDQIGEWTEVRLPDGNKGWVPGDCFEKI